ncbi:STAS domain-containing protein [Nonomuraea sp. SMC257]|uniref:Anti-sigma factor antagonist n=1 Tax=Nonomuraea montanisoli TaxID=2741721 RepID=A0A7Y6M2Y9_9ACTN|nr:STAS domain-containing protein [Nonomuraea montanisoli]NUW32657.1 STAS domain-containing protein [Nonomuraea montanisoli]
MARLVIDMERHGDVDVVRLTGELDMSSKHLLTTALAGPLAAERPRIVLDMAGLRFCDSSGLWQLIDSQRRAESRGGGLRLAGVRGVLARLLTITQLVDQFPPYGSLEDACHWSSLR